jgi:hypothetical protein
MKKSQIHLFWNDDLRVKRFRTGVSLHSHTMRSREKLGVVPRYANRLPFAGGILALHQRGYRRRHGRDLDFSRAYWTPPAPEREALRIERGQIERVLGLDSMVSLTDHDSIDAPLHLRVLEEARDLPISMEWSVPFGATTLHLGVHNLPAAEAHHWGHALAGYTRRPSPALLADLLAALDDRQGVLLVLNHPSWDEEGVGSDVQMAAVKDFLAGYGLWVHAIEVNGLRPWPENSTAIELARAVHLPLVSGGDRHGLEPAAVLNLTNAASFGDFVGELRNDKISDLLFMPHYRESFRARYLEAIWDVLRDYPEHVGRTRWSDRCFFVADDGRHLPLSSLWKGNEPWALKLFLAAVNLSGNSRVRSTLRSALSGNEVSL